MTDAKGLSEVEVGELIGRLDGGLRLRLPKDVYRVAHLKIMAIFASHAAMAERLKALEAHLNAMPSQLMAYKADVKVLRKERDQLTADLATVTAERDNLRLRIHAVDKEHEELERRKATTCIAFEVIEAENQRLRAAVEALVAGIHPVDCVEVDRLLAQAKAALKETP